MTAKREVLNYFCRTCPVHLATEHEDRPHAWNPKARGPRGRCLVPSCPCEVFLVGAPLLGEEIHDHRKLPVEDLMATCPPCGEAKIRWMAAHPASSHLGRNGRRLLERFELQ